MAEEYESNDFYGWDDVLIPALIRLADQAMFAAPAWQRREQIKWYLLY